MTREQAKKKLVELGIAEPTEEQVTKYLDTVTEATKSEKTKYEQLKAENDALKVENGQLGELQAKIEEAENSKLSEMDKISKQLEQSNRRVAELEKSIAVSNQRTSAAEKFKITAEQAGQVVKDDGSLDFDLLGQIISEKETNAVSEYEKKKLAETQNPGGAGGSGSGDDSPAKDIVIAAAKRAGMANESILNNYRR